MNAKQRRRAVRKSIREVGIVQLVTWRLDDARPIEIIRWLRANIPNEARIKTYAHIKKQLGRQT